MPIQRAERPIFEGAVVSITGELEGQWTEANISRWLTQRRGRLVQAMDETVTHLVCTEDEFRKKGPKGKSRFLDPRYLPWLLNDNLSSSSDLVRRAIRLGRKACHIITKDWLEDSITRKRKLPERDYSLYAISQEERSKEKQEAGTTKAVGLEDKFVNTNLYHIYSDEMFFDYKVTLTRDNPDIDVQGERYILHLFESNARPRLYLFAVKHYKKKGDTQASFHRPSSTAQQFRHEFTLFKAFFKKKTGLDWNARIAKAGTMDRTYFQYEPPVGGKPLGIVQGEFANFVPTSKEAADRAVPQSTPSMPVTAHGMTDNPPPGEA